MQSKIKSELSFFGKVFRNGLILSGLYLVSIFGATNDLTFTACKPIIIFLSTYVLTELTKRYGLDKGAIPLKNKKGSVSTLFY